MSSSEFVNWNLNLDDKMVYIELLVWMLVKYPARNCRLILGLLKYAVTTVQVIVV
jgi:hypothetical protein